MVLTRTYSIDKDLWYRQGLMVLTTPMVLTKTHGIESVILNHTHTRGPSVTRLRDFFTIYIRNSQQKRILCGLHYKKRTITAKLVSFMPSLTGSVSR